MYPRGNAVERSYKSGINISSQWNFLYGSNCKWRGRVHRKPGWKGKRRSVTRGALKRQLRKWRKNPQTLRFPFAFVKQTSPIFVTGATTVPMEKTLVGKFSVSGHCREEGYIGLYIPDKFLRHHHSLIIDPQRHIRKYIPEGRLVLTVLKSTLPWQW